MDPWLRFPWRRFWFWWVKCLGTLAVSSVLVLTALGYRWNAAVGGFQATAVLDIATIAHGQQAEVLLNGVSYGTHLLPWRQAWLTPGRYDVELRSEGYTSVESRIELGPGERAAVRGMLLRYEMPRPEEARVVPEAVPLRFTVRNGEIFDGHVYLARLSGDVSLAGWVPETGHLVLQQGELLSLLHVQRRELTPYFALPESASAFSVSSDGRLVEVTKQGEVVVYALWAEIPLTRRLAAYR